MVGIGRLVVIIGMASRALRRGTLESTGMAFQAIGAYMSSREREVGAIMVKHIISVARRVAGKAGIALIYIPSYPIVLIVRFRIGMAGGAGKFSVIRGVRMAVRTLAPLTVMCPTVYREIQAIVIKGGRNPGIFTMTGVAIGRKLGRDVIRVRRSIEISCMAANAGIGGIIVIPIMTGGAIIGNGCMCPIQRIIIIVNGKSRRRPTWFRRMTHRTIIRQAQRRVIGVGGCTII